MSKYKTGLTTFRFRISITHISVGVVAGVTDVAYTTATGVARFTGLTGACTGGQITVRVGQISTWQCLAVLT